MKRSQRLLTTGEAANVLGLRRWKLQYFVERGVVTSPSASVPGRRLFTRADIRRIKKQIASLSTGNAKPETEVAP